LKYKVAIMRNSFFIF